MKTLDGWPGVEYTIVAQDSHRNGVGGEGFVATIIDAIVDGSYHRFVCTSFTPYIKNNLGDMMSDRERNRRMFAAHTAVLDVEMTARGNINFAGGNSWRGSDVFGTICADAWFEACQNDEFGPYDPFDTEA